MASTWRAEAGASSTRGGKIPEGDRCLRTPSGAPDSSQSARSGSGSSARSETARNRGAFRPGPASGPGRPRACATLTRASPIAR
eukprot:10760222-Alexandrium_andersonii.AAC.1